MRRLGAGLPAQVRALRATLLRHPRVVPLLGTRPVVSPGSFAVMDAAVTILLDAGFGPQDAADAVDCAARLVVGHALAEAGSPPVRDLSGGEAEHQHAQQELSPAEFPGLTAVNQAGVSHDPGRLFEYALRGLSLELTRTGKASRSRCASGSMPGSGRPSSAGPELGRDQPGRGTGVGPTDRPTVRPGGRGGW